MRCEGWTRHGGAFSFGPATWSQCEKDAVVMLKVMQKEGESNQPACLDCWRIVTENKIYNETEILEVVPLAEGKDA